MDLAIIGTGYVGLVTGTCLAESGNNVICVDIDPKKIEMLKRGQIPIYEPGLKELVARNIAERRLSFTTSIKEAMHTATIVFIAVGTPPKKDGSADLSFVLSAAKEIGRSIKEYVVVVNKSTVPVGTGTKVREAIAKETKTDFDLVSNPEFLKEGNAIADFMKPDRIVIGYDSARALSVMRELYEPFVRTFHPVIAMDIASAEMTKYASNCFLAAKISFINEISNLCEKMGANIDCVREGIGADNRIGYEFLFPGVGFGGSCFPKDVQAIISIGDSVGIEMSLLKAVDVVNRKQKDMLFSHILAYYGVSDVPNCLQGKHFCVWGLSFKPGTDDMREAPSIVIIERLLAAGASVCAFDPVAMQEAAKIFKDKIAYAQDMYEASKNADALVLVTEWGEFKRPSWKKLKDIMKGNIVFDGRNIYHQERIKLEGFKCFGMGRTPPEMQE